MAVQDGMTAELVRRHADPAVIFVGGSTRFKYGTLGHWCGHFLRVHVGRVNSHRRLWECQRAGAESVDGTGLMRTDAQRAGLIRYLADQARGLRVNPDLSHDLFEPAA